MNHIRVDVFVVVLVLSVFVIESRCANILGVFPYKMKSHYIMFQSIMTELAKRGHNVTVINQFPIDPGLANFTDIDITGCSILPDLFSIETTYSVGSKPLQQILLMTSQGIEMYKNVPGGMFECEPMKRFLNANNSYDLVITELFDGDVNLGFVNKFQAPHIAFCAGPIYPWAADRMGNPSNPSYISYPHTDVEFDRYHPTFSQRLHNTLYYLYAKILHFYYSFEAENLVKNVFGSEIPRLDDIARNTSLILSFSHFSFNSPLPLVPGVVEIAGVQIKEPEPLPKDIQKFIDESEQGVIYFCMGSLLKVETMSEPKRLAFLNAFSQLPHRVIWKWDGELPGKTDRIFTSKWMPQRSILAHPKVKLFIAHGGALGINEAIYEGVPVLGIPIFGDQTTNIVALKANGAGEILHYPDINNDTVMAKIQQVLQPEYSRNMKKLSKTFKDRPMSAMDTAIYWIEYVIRHKGAHHLRSAAVDLPLYQYLLLDVIFFLFGVLFISIFLVYYFIRKLFSLFVRKSQDISKKKN